MSRFIYAPLLALLVGGLVLAGSDTPATAAPAKPAAAAESGATAAVRAANERFKKLLAQKAPSSRLTQEFRGLFDIGDLARRALVDHWDKMVPTDRDALVDILRQLIERNYVSSIRSQLNYKVRYLGEEARGKDTLVKTMVDAKRKGRPVSIAIDYMLVKDAAGWRVIDVITDDISMLDNYRSQFNRIIAKDGVAGLRARMEKKLAEGEGGEGK